MNPAPMNAWLTAAAYCAVVVGLGVLIISLSAVLGPRRRKPGKLDTYECGKPLLGSSRERFSVHFYLVAIFFILFDIETVFMIPYAVLHRELGPAGLAEAAVFVAVLACGLVYLWKRRAIEWDWKP